MRAFRIAFGGCASLLAGMALCTSAVAQIGISVSLDSPIDGPDAPFLVAFDKGYYKAEGLNVSIDPATSSLEAINRVAAGGYEIGFADINALIRFRDVNPTTPVKAVFMVHNRPPFAIIARKSRGITSPKDLEGKKLGAAALDSSYAQWPIFVKVNEIDTAKVTIENVGFPVREPLLMSGQVDAITGSSYNFAVNLKDRGMPASEIAVLRMADYGVNLYGGAIIVNPKFAADRPEAVKGFLRAYLRALRDTIKTPSSAVNSVVRRNEMFRKPVELERLQMALRDNIMTPEVKLNGYGGVDPGRFDAAIEQTTIAYRFRANKPKLDDIFDASFLPPAAERKF